MTVVQFPGGRVGPREMDAIQRRGGRVVYFIRSEVSGHIKIGIALDPKARLSGLKTGHPGALTLLGIIRDENPERLERYLHDCFRGCHVSGEWFEPHDNLLDYIETVAISLAEYRTQLAREARARLDAQH